jgi:hypothetical protein
MTTPRELPSAWRERAGLLRHHGADEAAKTAETLADELEAAFSDENDAALTIAQAVAESGYSADHLARQIRAGKIPNAGRPHAPRILRAHLPHKPGALRAACTGDMLYDARRRMAATVAHSRHGD